MREMVDYFARLVDVDSLNTYKTTTIPLRRPITTKRSNGWLAQDDHRLKSDYIALLRNAFTFQVR
jgi:hypothetical protein